MSWAVSRLCRAALDSAARTPPFNRSPRWTSRHTTATTGGPTNICCQGPPHGVWLQLNTRRALHSYCLYLQNSPPCCCRFPPQSLGPALVQLCQWSEEVLCSENQQCNDAWWEGGTDGRGGWHWEGRSKLHGYWMTPSWGEIFILRIPIKVSPTSVLFSFSCLFSKRMNVCSLLSFALFFFLLTGGMK